MAPTGFPTGTVSSGRDGSAPDSGPARDANPARNTNPQTRIAELERENEALRSAVEACETENVHLVEGPDLMDATGLTTDILHPGDAGMEAIGSGLADIVGPLVE